MTIRGHTLVEVLVVLAILGVIVGVGVVALRPEMKVDGRMAHPSILLARHRAMATGQRATVSYFQSPGIPATATALPDGRVVADSGSGLDLFTGRGRATR
jgi:prepilin-type N-terminal cleavage/methylation domain-containing protein